MSIINLTQHPSSKEQIEQGVVEPKSKKEVSELLTIFWGDDLEAKAAKLAMIAKSYGKAMIGGAPYLMPVLEKHLKNHGVEPVYAFSDRISEEFTNDEEEVEKKMTFKHKGFYSAENGFLDV